MCFRIYQQLSKVLEKKRSRNVIFSNFPICTQSIEYFHPFDILSKESWDSWGISRRVWGISRRGISRRVWFKPKLKRWTTLGTVFLSWCSDSPRIPQTPSNVTTLFIAAVCRRCCDTSTSTRSQWKCLRLMPAWSRCAISLIWHREQRQSSLLSSWRHTGVHSLLLRVLVLLVLWDASAHCPTYRSGRSVGCPLLIWLIWCVMRRLAFVIWNIGILWGHCSESFDATNSEILSKLSCSLVIRSDQIFRWISLAVARLPILWHMNRYIPILCLDTMNP